MCGRSTPLSGPRPATSRPARPGRPVRPVRELGPERRPPVRRRRCGLAAGRVEGADDVAGQVHARIGPDETAVGHAEHHVHLLLLRDPVDHGIQLALELRLQLLLQRLDVLLGVLGEALEIALLPLDLGLQLRPGPRR